jgi:hypothetical protein
MAHTSADEQSGEERESEDDHAEGDHAAYRGGIGPSAELSSLSKNVVHAYLVWVIRRRIGWVRHRRAGSSSGQSALPSMAVERLDT